MAEITYRESVRDEETDTRPRWVRAAEQNFEKGFRLIIDGRRRTARFTQGSTILSVDFSRALSLGRLFRDTYPGQISRIGLDAPATGAPAAPDETPSTTPSMPATPAEDLPMSQQTTPTPAIPIILDEPEYTAAQLAELAGLPTKRFVQLHRQTNNRTVGSGKHARKLHAADAELVRALAGYGVTAQLADHLNAVDYSGDGQASTEPEPAAEVVQISAEPVQIADEVVPVPAEAVHNPAESVHTGAEDPAEAPQAETEAVRAELEQQAYRNRRMYPILEAEPAPRFWFERTPEERILDFLSPVRGLTLDEIARSTGADLDEARTILADLLYQRRAIVDMSDPRQDRFLLVEDQQPDPEIENVRRVVERVHQATIRPVRQIVVENPAEHLSAAAGELAAALLDGDQVTIGRARRIFEAAVDRCNRAAGELASASSRILDQVDRAQRIAEACEESRVRRWWRF